MYPFLRERLLLATRYLPATDSLTQITASQKCRALNPRQCSIGEFIYEPSACAIVIIASSLLKLILPPRLLVFSSNRPIKARNYMPLAVAAHAGIPVTLKSDFDLAAMKADGTLPFGQVPYFVHGNVKMAQSGAIVRYCAKIGGLEGSTTEEYVLSEQLIEEAQDIFSLFRDAHYPANGDKVASFNALFGEARDGKFYKHLENLERLKPDGSVFFNSGDKRLAGGICIAVVLDIAVRLEPTCLDESPKMKAFYEAMIALPCFDGIRDMNMYFSR